VVVATGPAAGISRAVGSDSTSAANTTVRGDLEFDDAGFDDAGFEDAGFEDAGFEDARFEDACVDDATPVPACVDTGAFGWCGADDGARPGVASRRSGAAATAKHDASRTAGARPPALCVRILRTPPFPCGLDVDCVGIVSDARRGRSRHQLPRQHESPLG